MRLLEQWNKNNSVPETSQKNQNANQGTNGFAVPSLSLPKGGGSIRSIGEKFSTNPATGAGTITVPIFTSPGRSGFDPKLSIAYNSGSGNGPFGFGWDLSLPSITRKTEKLFLFWNFEATLKWAQGFQ